MMNLDATGWPQLPTVGSKIEFRGGDILLQVLGVCTIIRADHACNATGKPGGQVTIQTDRGELVEVTLSQVRSHADLVADGLQSLKFEANLKAQAKWLRELSGLGNTPGRSSEEVGTSRNDAQPNG
jgi:hypothetical protein